VQIQSMEHMLGSGGGKGSELFCTRIFGPSVLQLARLLPRFHQPWILLPLYTAIIHVSRLGQRTFDIKVL
jgi:hypothetical protein